MAASSSFRITKLHVFVRIYEYVHVGLRSRCRRERKLWLKWLIEESMERGPFSMPTMRNFPIFISKN